MYIYSGHYSWVITMRKYDHIVSWKYDTNKKKNNMTLVCMWNFYTPGKKELN